MARNQRDEDYVVAGEGLTVSVGSGHSLTMDTAPAGVTISAAYYWEKKIVGGVTYYSPLWR